MATITTIILTSTVNVDVNKSFLFQTDRNERLTVYLKSIRQWLDNTSFNIVVVDNSGHKYEELEEYKKKYGSRFEVVSFVENELEETMVLRKSASKGVSEIFAIHYAFKNSMLAKHSVFIIKITARYFIPDLEDYLQGFDLNLYDCLTQNNRDRCELVGSHSKNFDCIFEVVNSDVNLHIETFYKDRTSRYKNILECKVFEIEKTQRGGDAACFVDI